MMTRFPQHVRLFALALLAVLFTACSTGDLARVTDLQLSDQPLTGKFVWHDLITDDVQRARRFYGGVLDWSFESTTGPNGGDYTLILSGNHFVGGMVERRDPQGVDYSRWLPYVSVNDVDRAVALTNKEGGAAVAGPVDLTNIGRAAAIQDPQGAVLGLLRSRHGDPVDTVESASGRVVWNELLASDDAAALTFYRSLAGYEVEAEPRGQGEYYLLFSQGRERAGVMQRPDDEISPVWLTHFAVDDVEAAAGRAEELGGTVLLQPSPELRDGTMALVQDPTGAIFALRQLN
jgi:predicted enzyme related to lactoylglutathione lyase